MTGTIERSRESIDSLIDRTHQAVVGATARAERGVESAAQHVIERSREAGEAVRDGAETASRQAHHRVDHAAQVIDRGYARARSDLNRAAAATTEYLAENPGKALLIAAAAGFAVGLVMRPRRLSS